MDLAPLGVGIEIEIEIGIEIEIEIEIEIGIEIDPCSVWHLALMDRSNFAAQFSQHRNDTD